METDRELLELAAKAAGFVVAGLADKMLVDPEHRAGGFIVETPTGGHTAWNPLTDDGDALRLAVKLGIVWRYFHADWRYKTGVIEVCVSETHGPKPIHDEPVRDWSAIAAVTRRAIVRAAAEIGKGMK